MNPFIQILENLDLNAIRAEVKDKRIKDSKILNTILDNNYSFTKKFKSTKKKFTSVWNKIVKDSFVRGSLRIWFKLFAATQKLIQTIYENENSSENMFSVLRNAIFKKYGKEAEIYKESVYKLGVSRERSLQRRAEYSAKVSERNKNRGDLTAIYVEDIISKIEELAKSNNPYEYAIAVLLCTASRPIEVFKISKFKSTQNEKEILIKSLAKGKLGSTVLKDVEVLRPLIALKGETIADLVDDLRNNGPNLRGNNKTISNRISGPLNEVFRKHIQPLAPNNEMSVYACRAIGVNCSYLIYGKPKNQPYETWIQSYLGHMSGESTKSYLAVNVKLKNKIIREAPNDIKQIFDKKIVELQAKIDKCCPISDEKLEGLAAFKNSRTRKELQPQKIQKVVDALVYLKSKNIKMTQKELQRQLELSSGIMSKGYKKARENGVI